MLKDGLLATVLRVVASGGTVGNAGSVSAGYLPCAWVLLDYEVYMLVNSRQEAMEIDLEQWPSILLDHQTVFTKCLIV